MIELEYTPCKDKPFYQVTVCAEINLSSYSYDYKERTVQIKDENWAEIDTLFFSYVNMHKYFSKWDKNHKDEVCFGKYFKKNPILKNWVGLWATGEMEDPLDLSWDSIYSVKILHIDANGMASEVNLPNVEELFNSEEDFAKAFNEAALARSEEIKSNYGWIEPWELEKLKDILKQFGWSDEQLENMFYGYSDNGFNEISVDPEDNSAYNIIVNKICNIEKATSGTKCYSGFKEETLDKLKKAINDCDLGDEPKKFAIDILTKYNGNFILEDWEKKVLKDSAFNDYKMQTYGHPSGTNGYSGIYMEEYDSYEDLFKRSDYIHSKEDLEEYVDPECFREYNGKLYILKEAD